MEVVPFAPAFESEVVELILGIQRGEFGIEITAAQQPDLREIPSTYQTGAGNFWVARVDGRVAGTIGLLDIGDRQAALRKMFVTAKLRGPAPGVAQELLRTLLAWAEGHGLREIFLGTTPFFRAAHRFYEKNAFQPIAKAELPDAFPIMEVDTRFYHRRVVASRA